jgi:hypothetical protein
MVIRAFAVPIDESGATIKNWHISKGLSTQVPGRLTCGTVSEGRDD